MGMGRGRGLVTDARSFSLRVAAFSAFLSEYCSLLSFQSPCIYILSCPAQSRLTSLIFFLLALAVCVIIPLLAHSALLKKSQSAILLDRAIFIVSVVMMLVGTVCAFTQSAD